MVGFYMQGVCRVLDMSDYGAICLNNAWVCLIIFVTKVIRLEFLSTAMLYFLTQVGI